MTTPSLGHDLLRPQSRANSSSQRLPKVATLDNDHARIISRASSRTRVTGARREAIATDPTTDPAILSLIRRVLIPDHSTSQSPRSSSGSIEETLPPLTSSNDVDTQLYAIIAIIVKDFVNSWYSQITPDRNFQDEIIAVIAHVSRALEQRIRHIDIAELMLDDLPILLERHISAYRSGQTYSKQLGYSSHARQIYHTLVPHPALEPLADEGQPDTIAQQQENEVAYRQLLTEGALAVLLPTEDLQNTPLRLLVGDILADLIIGQALAGKVCEGWFLHSAVTLIIDVLTLHVEPEGAGQGVHHGSNPRLEEFGLLSSGADRDTSPAGGKGHSILSFWFWRIMQGIYFTVLAVRFVIKGLLQARSDPARLRAADLLDDPPHPFKGAADADDVGRPPRPVLSYHIYGVTTYLLCLNDRMPWLVSVVAFLQHVLLFGMGGIATIGSVFDCFLHKTVTTVLFPPSVIPIILSNLRINLFPNNTLAGPAPPPPSDATRLQIRRKAAESLLSLIPLFVAEMYYGSDNKEEILDHIENEILAVFDDQYMNKHLIYGLLECILVRLVPELQGRSVSELLAERGVISPSRTGSDDDDNEEEEEEEEEEKSNITTTEKQKHEERKRRHNKSHKAATTAHLKPVDGADEEDEDDTFVEFDEKTPNSGIRIVVDDV